MADRFPLVANSSTSQIQEIPNGDTLDLSGNNVKGVGIITATTFSGNLTGSVTGNVTGNVSGTSGGLSGTPNITVGTVTGTDATFSGNLTVQGTTTTIDTAVTAVDSLNVDGAVVVGAGISAVGDVSIGGHVGNHTVNGLWLESSGDIRVTGSSSNTIWSGYQNGTAAATSNINADGTATFAGTVSDSIGPLRRLGINAHNAATYTLVAGDAGKLVREATNGANITIPQNVFAAGDMISIFNVSGGDNTITQGTGTTLYNTGDGATGNRTLAAKGVCTIVCTSTNEFIISGSQVS